MNKPVLYGILSAFLLLAIYFSIVGILQGMEYATARFIDFWYLMLPLVAGFGLQMGLFTHIHTAVKAGTAVAASGGTSTFSMIACCAHHITDVAPVIGATAFGIFLIEYQASFLALGIVSNILGIIFMLSVAKKAKVKFKNPVFKGIMKQNLEKALKISAVIGLIVVALAFVLVKPPAVTVTDGTVTLEALSHTANAVTFSVLPEPIKASEAARFGISINTHSVELDFDVDKISKLVADGREIRPVKWEGAGLGGHHRSGTLIFPPLGTMPKNLRLVIQDSATRIFEWNVA